jgi:hypothetical protein
MKNMESQFNKKESIEEKFSESKVRDEDGKLMEVYHFSDSKIDKFSNDFVGNATEGDKGFFGAGIYFTESDDAYNHGKNKHPAYLNLKNPLILRNPTMDDVRSLHGKKEEILEQGYDGVMVWNDATEGKPMIMGKTTTSTSASPAQWTELVVFDVDDIHLIKDKIE